MILIFVLSAWREHAMLELKASALREMRIVSLLNKQPSVRNGWPAWNNSLSSLQKWDYFVHQNSRLTRKGKRTAFIPQILYPLHAKSEGPQQQPYYSLGT